MRSRSPTSAAVRLVLAFYPLDFSAVCRDQLSIYQEVLGEIEDRGAALVGVSVDSSASATPRFASSLALTFPLLADFHPKGAVAPPTAPIWTNGVTRTVHSS